MCHIFYTALLKFEEFMIRSINGKIVIEDGEFANICVKKQDEENEIHFECCGSLLSLVGGTFVRSRHRKGV